MVVRFALRQESGLDTPKNIALDGRCETHLDSMNLIGWCERTKPLHRLDLWRLTNARFWGDGSSWM